MEKHLAVCKQCARELNRLKACLGLTIDSLASEYEVPAQNEIWERVRKEIKSPRLHPEQVSKVRFMERLAAIRTFFRQSSMRKSKLCLATSIIVAVLILIIIIFVHNPEKEVPNVVVPQTYISDLENYPVIEQVEMPDVTIMTIKTEDPDIQIVWFFDDNLKL